VPKKGSKGPQDIRRLLGEGPPVTAATRSVMLANKGRDTGPEMVVRRALHAAGLRYVLHDRRLPGRPDIVFPRVRLVIEVRGCFWHGHICMGARVPKTRSAYWAEKISINQARDARNEGALRERGWEVIVAWECEVRQHGPQSLVEAARSRLTPSTN
jgi:DNA mismatch endonuclease (patch repair protein)